MRNWTWSWCSALRRTGPQAAWSPDGGATKTTLGILLQRRDRPESIYKIALRKGYGDCLARVESATASDVVLSCTSEKGESGPNRKFIYDIRSKRLVKQIDYAPFALRRIFVSGGGAVLFGTDTRQLVAVKYSPGAEPALHLLNGAQTQQWGRRISLAPIQFKPVRFGPGARFTLAQDDNGNSAEKRLAVLDGIGGRDRRYALPQTSYDEFARLRPARVENGYSPLATTIDEAVGPWQIVDGALWFAKKFYDGEGNTGLGGLGYFDANALKYRIYSPPELAAWSSTAMLVEPRTVWVGLANNGEYGSTGGGLLQFDRATEKAERIEFHELVNEIARVGDRLLLATDFGVMVLENRRPRRFFVDRTINGGLQVAESVLGN